MNNVINKVRNCNKDYLEMVYKKYVIYNYDWSPLLGIYMEQNWDKITHFYPYRNHPIGKMRVNRGEAYWLNSQTICCGYQLKNNQETIRPLHQPNRDRLMNSIHNDIIKYAIQNILIDTQKIPVDIVNKITKSVCVQGQLPKTE